MKLIEIIFPIKLYLTIFQLEGYQFARFLTWLSKNFWARKLPEKKAFVLTTKVKMIIIFTLFWALLLALIVLLLSGSLLITTLFILILAFQPYLVFWLATGTLKPYEIYNRRQTIEKTRAKILSFSKLTVVGITGSYAKTSVKEILYQILKTKYAVLRTPESYNTLFGIAKVVDYELDNSYQYFLCEMGAYKKGEIRELCNTTNPKFGIITGIARQHLERFGSLENIIQAKFELVDHVDDPKKITFNGRDKNVSSELKKRNIHQEESIKASGVKFSANGSEFYLEFPQERYKIKTKLFGYSQIKNIILAASFARQIGLSPSDISKSISKLQPFSSRLTLSQNKKATLVDNTYNSNEAGFKEMLRTAKLVKGKRALVTPGLVELGEDEQDVHRKLGRKAQGIFDRVVLVGKNKRTQALAKGLDKNYIYIKDAREDYFENISTLSEKYDWVFLENDVTQNY